MYMGLFVFWPGGRRWLLVAVRAKSTGDQTFGDFPFFETDTCEVSWYLGNSEFGLQELHPR